MPAALRLLRSNCILVLMLCCLSAAAGATASASEKTASLTLMNRPVVQFRASLLGATPEQRARRAERNLLEILQQQQAPQVSIKASPQGNIVQVGGTMAFVLTPGDVDTLSDDTLDTLTTRTLTTLQRQIAEYAESQSLEAWLKGFAWLVGETIIFGLIIWALSRARRWLHSRGLRLAARQASRLNQAGAQLNTSKLLGVLAGALALPYWSLIALLFYTWLSTVLAHFPYTRVWGEQLSAWLLEVIISLMHSIVGALPDLLVAAVMFLLAHGFIRMLRPFFDRVEEGRGSYGWLDAETVRPTRRLLTTGIWIFALVMAYPYLPGSHSEAFKGMSVLLGLMISLGASSIVGQGASGLILMYTRTLRRGEYVRVGEHEGTIVEIGMFNTRLRTGRGSEISLPNALIVGQATTNYSRAVQGAGFVVDTTITIGYDTPWRQVEAMLIEAARRTNGIVADPRPAVFQTALSDFYPEYSLVCQAIPSAPRPRAEVLSELHANIQDVFNEYGVQIMSPHYLGDPAKEKIVPPSQWHTAPAQKN